MGPPRFRKKQCERRLRLRTRSPGGRRAWILSPPSALPSPSLPSSRLRLLGSTPSPHQFLPHFPALPGFSLEGPFSQRGADAEPHCLPPCPPPTHTQDLPLCTPPPSPQAWAFRHEPQGHCPSPHPKPAPGAVSNDSSHSEHDLFLTGSEKTVAWDLLQQGGLRGF